MDPINTISFTPDQIHQAVESVRGQRPAYEEMLSFYRDLFLSQENEAERLNVEPIRISSRVLELKNKEKLPLVQKNDIPVDPVLTEAMFRKICTIARNVTTELENSASRLLLELDNNALSIEKIIDGLLDENESIFEETATRFEIDKQILKFISYHSVKPFLTVFSWKMADAYLNEENLWQTGYCPVCGTHPVLSMFGDKGTRFLVCGFCWHQWPVKRIYCPFCNNSDGKKLQYFSIDGEKEYRVDCCDVCKKYIKTVDNREINRILYPLLEQISTLHLDFAAQEDGYENGLNLFLQG